jgi:hypothetical protein
VCGIEYGQFSLNAETLMCWSAPSLRMPGIGHVVQRVTATAAWGYVFLAHRYYVKLPSEFVTSQLHSEVVISLRFRASPAVWGNTSGQTCPVCSACSGAAACGKIRARTRVTLTPAAWLILGVEFSDHLVHSLALRVCHIHRRAGNLLTCHLCILRGAHTAPHST